MNRKGDQGAVAWRTATGANDAELSDRSAPEPTAQPAVATGMALEAMPRPPDTKRRSDTHKKLWVIARVTHMPIIASHVVKDLKRR
jgi:hypothetical protein